MTIVATLLAALLAAPTPADPADEEAPQVIRLKVGTEVVGTIVSEGFDEAKGIRIRRVDDDSLLDLSFDQMLPEDARRIRAAHGYLPDEPEPILVEATRIRLLDGEEFVGVIVEQGTETFQLRQGTKTWTFKRAGVREVVPVRVDALEVLDAEEFYAEELARRSLATALDHYNLALFAESLQLWPRVKEHLSEVQELDPQFKTDIVNGKLLRADLRLQSADESALLAKAQRFAQRDLYDAALGLLDEFLTKKPGSAMRAEFEKLRRTIAKNREKWIRGQVIFNFFIHLERTARLIANDTTSVCRVARKRMETEGSNLALEATAKTLKVKVEEVRAIWEDPKRQTASMHYANYGAGTWTLRDMEAVLKGLVKEDPTKDAANAGKEEAGSKDDSLEDRIKKLLEKKKKEQEEAQRRAKEKPKQKQAKAEIADIPPTEDEWWMITPADDKVDYLLAWWADHDEHAQTKPEGRPCAQCTGIGILRYFDRGGDDKWVPCPRCKGAQIDRIVRFH